MSQMLQSKDTRKLQRHRQERAGSAWSVWRARRIKTARKDGERTGGSAREEGELGTNMYTHNTFF